MVAFTRRRGGRREHLVVWTAARDPAMTRLVVVYPDGQRRLHCFAGDDALRAGAGVVQAELTAAGWTPIRRRARRGGRPATPAETETR